MSPYLQRLVTAVPEPRGQPAPAPAAGQASPTVFGLVAVCTWLITVGLGLWMMTRWIASDRLGSAAAGRPRRPPALNFAHLGLAITGLLAWITYLITGVTALAWTACALLAPTVGLGMTLVFLSVIAGQAENTITTPAVSGSPVADMAGEDPPRGRGPFALVLGAHIAFATATILFAFLAAIGG